MLLKGIERWQKICYIGIYILTNDSSKYVRHSLKWLGKEVSIIVCLLFFNQNGKRPNNSMVFHDYKSKTSEKSDQKCLKKSQNILILIHTIWTPDEAFQMGYCILNLAHCVMFPIHETSYLQEIMPSFFLAVQERAKAINCVHPLWVPRYYGCNGCLSTNWSKKDSIDSFFQFVFLSYKYVAKYF